MLRATLFFGALPAAALLLPFVAAAQEAAPAAPAKPAASVTRAEPAAVVADVDAIQADLVLRGGTIYDGVRDGFTGDVAIKKGRIVAVGAARYAGNPQFIECGGLIIAPGFIDLHNHSDRSIVAPSTRANTNFLTQGCTTIVTGNCGFGPVDVAKYYDEIDLHGAGTNVAHLLPHGDLRDTVFGKVDRVPTTSELEKMCDLAARAMRDGAWGMSTGLIYVPGTYARTEELVAVAAVVGRHGGIYASHIRNEGVELPNSIDEILRIGREAKLPVHVSHFKASGRDAWGTLHVAAEMIEKARAAGERVTADQYPYIASSTSLEATLLPAWSREGGRKMIEKRLADPATRAKVRTAIRQSLGNKVRVQIAGYDPRRDWIGKSLDEIAAADGREIEDIVLEIEARGGARIVNFGMHEDDVRAAMRLPWVATASDGSARVPDGEQPHPRNFGTFTRKLGVYAQKEGILSMRDAVRSSTSLPAEILGLKDRGLLRAGYAADVVVFDPKTVVDRATYDHPYRYSDGVRYVFVNGVAAIADGTPTGALGGRALRKAK